MPEPKQRSWTLKGLWTTLQNDPIAGLTLGIFLATALLYLVPVLADEQLTFASRRLGPFVFLTMVVAALHQGLDRVKAKADREFWRDLLRGFVCWWIAAALILFFPSPETKPFAVDFISSVLYALFYVFMLMAVESQPHRRHRWRPLRLERRLSWATVTAVTVGLFLYFPFLALWTDPEAYRSGIPDLSLYLTLDGYLSLRLVYLLRVTRSPRWRVTYALWAAASLTISGNDVAEALALATNQKMWHWDALGNVLLYLPYLFLVAAARLRHHPFPWEPPPPASRIRLEENLPGPLGQTMTFILIFPLIHFGGYELGLLEPPSQFRREVLILVWLPILGAIAVLQYRILERVLAELREERQSSERALHKTQKELRLAQERQHIVEALKASDKRFSKAFRACPDVMAISRLSDGHLIEVNDSCRKVFGYEPEEFVGHTSEELGLWADAALRAHAVEELDRHGQVTMVSPFRKKSGEERWGLFSARRIDIDGEKHLFSITRDVTRTKGREEALRRRIEPLEQAATAAWGVDRDGRVVLWNRAAERRFGWRAEERLDRPEAEVCPPGAAPPSAADGGGLASTAVLARDGETETVECLRIPVSSGGDLRGWLVFARDASSQVRR